MRYSSQCHAPSVAHPPGAAVSTAGLGGSFAASAGSPWVSPPQHEMGHDRTFPCLQRQGGGDAWPWTCTSLALGVPCHSALSPLGPPCQGACPHAGDGVLLAFTVMVLLSGDSALGCVPAWGQAWWLWADTCAEHRVHVFMWERRLRSFLAGEVTTGRAGEGLHVGAGRPSSLHHRAGTMGGPLGSRLCLCNLP